MVLWWLNGSVPTSQHHVWIVVFHLASNIRWGQFAIFKNVFDVLADRALGLAEQIVNCFWFSHSVSASSITSVRVSEFS